MIEVTTCGITNYSSTKNDVACMTGDSEAKSEVTISWREHMFFEPRNIHSSQIEQNTISIKVKNKGWLKEQLVGMYEFDVTKVYAAPKHAIQNQWIALFNPEGEDFSTITGNLKISISVQGPGDEQVQLNESTGPEDPNSLVMMPAQIKKEYKQLKIRFITAQGLPQLDTMGGTIDAFIQAQVMGKTMRTKAVTAKRDKNDGLVSAIEQELWIPLQVPMAMDRLILQLFDEDATNNEIVGSMNFSLKKLLKMGENGGTFWWQNIYGAPVTVSMLGGIVDSNNASVFMNNNPEVGSTWKGRMLMHVEAQDSKHPERDTRTLDNSIKETANN